MEAIGLADVNILGALPNPARDRGALGKHMGPQKEYRSKHQYWCDRCQGGTSGDGRGRLQKWLKIPIKNLVQTARGTA